MDKKKWDKPKLVVLVRGDRQEGVLQACKATDWPIGDAGPSSNYGACFIVLKNPVICSACSSMFSS